MTRRLFFALCLLLAISACKPQQTEALQAPVTARLAPVADNASVELAFDKQQSHVQVQGSGVVIKLLSDDNKGARHQRFLVKIRPKQILLFAHNIDLAPKLPLHTGDTVSFSGEYIYNPKGGVVHWTHLAPKGDHVSGWIMLNGTKYQ